MITNFEKETAPLTEDELKLVSVIIRCMKKYTSENPITEPQIVSGMKASGHKFTGSTLRKIINYIRGNSIAPIIATSKGYFMSNDLEQIRKQIQSLEDRMDALRYAAEGLKVFLMVQGKLSPHEDEQEN